MLSRGGTYGGSRGASFSQMLKNNICAPPGLAVSYVLPPCRLADVPAARCTSRTGPVSEPKITPTVLMERYKLGETHAVSALYQLSQVLCLQLELKETVTTGNVPGLYFAFCAVIDGVVYKTGMGITKKQARLQAAELALEDLLPTLKSESLLPEAAHGPPPLPVKEGGNESSRSEVHPGRAIHERKNPMLEQICQAVREQLSMLMNSHPEFSACAVTTAAFITQSSSGYEVVAIGTGNFNTKESAMPNGRILHDSHAVVAARRSLMRYLYRHLLLFYSRTPSLKEKSIFQQDNSSKLLSLKAGIALHLFINQMPKGAAVIPSNLRLNPLSLSAWELNNQISLHVTVEGKVFSVFSSIHHSDSKVVSMSATDKITQWQVLGFQGALLSHFTEPIYVSSILVGDASCSDVRGMEVAINRRVDGITPRLPMYYCTYRPHISLVPSVAADGSSSIQTRLGLNWSQGDTSLEVVDGIEGKTVDESPFKSGPALASRLCKAAMLSRFNLVAKEAQRPDLLATVSYREAKMMAKPYQEAKNVLKSYLVQQGYGSWVLKSPVSDHFSM